MRTLFNHNSLIQQQNIIVILYRLQSMSNRNHCKSLFLHLLLQLTFSIIIKGTSCLIQNQYFRFLYQSPSNSNSLFLSSTQFIASKSNIRIQSILPKNINTLSISNSSDSFLFRYIFFSNLHII